MIRQPPPPRFFDAPSRESARADLGLSADEFFVFSFAIHQPYRRSEDLIEAASQLGDIPGLRVLIAGSDHENPEYVRGLHELVAARDLGSRVTVRGEAIVDADLRNHMAAADAFVFVSRRQSYGLAPLEAIASRTPVVVSTGAGVSELIGGRPGVFAAPPEDPGAIAAALRAIHAGDGAQGVLESARVVAREHDLRALRRGRDTALRGGHGARRLERARSGREPDAGLGREKRPK